VNLIIVQHLEAYRCLCCLGRLKAFACALEVTYYRQYMVLEYSDEKDVNIHNDCFAYKDDMRVCCGDACRIVAAHWLVSRG